MPTPASVPLHLLWSPEHAVGYRVPGRRARAAPFPMLPLRALLSTQACADRFSRTLQPDSEKFITCKRCPIRRQHHEEHNPSESVAPLRPVRAPFASGAAGRRHAWSKASFVRRVGIALRKQNADTTLAEIRYATTSCLAPPSRRSRPRRHTGLGVVRWPALSRVWRSPLAQACV
jgi:hypothetical protein